MNRASSWAISQCTESKRRVKYVGVAKHLGLEEPLDESTEAVTDGLSAAHRDVLASEVRRILIQINEHRTPAAHWSQRGIRFWLMCVNLAPRDKCEEVQSR
jgi:hypothetical protein